LGFPYLAPAALANKVRLRRLEEWKREESQRTQFAILYETPAELRPKKGGSDRGVAKSKHLANHLMTSAPPPWAIRRKSRAAQTLPSLN